MTHGGIVFGRKKNTCVTNILLMTKESILTTDRKKECVIVPQPLHPPHHQDRYFSSSSHVIFERDMRHYVI